MFRTPLSHGGVLLRRGPATISRNPLVLGLKGKSEFQGIIGHQLIHKHLLSLKDGAVVPFIRGKADRLCSQYSSSTGTREGEKDLGSRPLGYYVLHDNTLITPERAMKEYLLNCKHIDKLLTYHIRTPFTEAKEKYILMVKKVDVEKLVIDVYGSMEAMEAKREKVAREASMCYRLKRKVLRFLGIIRKKSKDTGPSASEKAFLDEMDAIRNLGTSKKSYFIKELKEKMPTFINIGLALVVNLFLTYLKYYAYMSSGSHSLFAEGVHSLADSLNQITLMAGFLFSLRKSDEEHPYGFRGLRYISSLTSGVGIFWLGAGVNFYHGFSALKHASPITYTAWDVMVLPVAFVLEGVTLVMACRSIWKESKEHNMSFIRYIHQGINPNLNVILLEDASAVVGILIAAGCMGLSHIYGDPSFDAMGSCAIGALLACASSYIIYANSQALLGRAPRITKPISSKIESDRMVRSVLDIKAIEMGDDSRYKCEVNYDGKQIAQDYLLGEDLDALLKEAKAIDTTEDLKEFLGQQGDNTINHLAAHIDRMEGELKKEFPNLRHIDMEPS